MSLNYELGQIENWQELKDGPAWGITECTIWAAMICGVPVLDAKTLNRFYKRVHAWETAMGTINTTGEPITYGDLKRRLGLRTNASSMTDADWRKKLVRALDEEAQRTIFKANQDAERKEQDQ